MGKIENRRFPRVTVHSGLAELMPVFGAQVTWPNLEISDVTDLGLGGLAARRPGLFPIDVQSEVELAIRLGDGEPFPVRARIAWSNADLVGLEVKDLQVDGRLRWRSFVDAKLLGLGLRAVDEKFKSPGQTFKYWFQGPGGRVNIFIYEDEERRIQKVVFAGINFDLELKRGESLQRVSAEQKRALLVLSQLDKPELLMEDFLRSLGE